MASGGKNGPTLVEPSLKSVFIDGKKYTDLEKLKLG